MSDLDPVARTARLTTALRARESERPDRLFTDVFAGVLAGETARALADQLGEVPAIGVRTRFFDDLLTRIARAEGGPRQFVLLAAGMDSRAQRLPFPAAITLYEVDRPELLRLKDALLADVPEPVCRRVAVSADLAGDWPRALAQAGFEAGLPTCWLVEGLTQYLQEADVIRLFDRVTACSSPGSHLLAEFVGASVFRDPAARPTLDALAEQGAAWHCGTDKPQPLFTERGWQVKSVSYAEVGRQWDAGPRMALRTGATWRTPHVEGRRAPSLSSISRTCTPPCNPAWSQFRSHSRPSAWVQTTPRVLFSRRSGRARTRADSAEENRKACWGQPLTSSNLVSSAGRRPAPGHRGGPSAFAVSSAVSTSRFGFRPAGRSAGRTDL